MAVEKVLITGKKLAAVVATGHQGGSCADSCTGDPGSGEVYTRPARPLLLVLPDHRYWCWVASGSSCLLHSINMVHTGHDQRKIFIHHANTTLSFPGCTEYYEDILV